ncbi:MAG: 50S ribosomal protein L23 [Chloroflexi bacterium CFX6]|nr:50S ribosomal protein L23 [Chloroflexi bacterium CFX6]
MDKYAVLRRPIGTEKTDFIGDLNQYAFEVALEANKREVQEAVEHLFDVKVDKVRTMVMPGKQRRWGRRITRTSRWKKAIVTLVPGDKIDLS